MKKRCEMKMLPWVGAFLGTWAVKWMIHAQGDKLGYTNSILALAVCGVLYVLLKKISLHEFGKKRIEWILPGLVGGVFSACMVFGTQLDLYGSVPFTQISMWMAILILGVLGTVMIRFFWDILFGQTVPEDVSSQEEDAGKVGVKSWLGRTCVIFFCYLPVFLAVYPGFFVYDALDELNQVVTRSFSNHHPLIHVLLLGGIVQAGYKLTGSYNVGIAIYTFFQMLVMAGIFAWCVEWLKKKGLRRTGRILLTFYFGLCPVLVMFSLCSAKDGLFTGMILILLLLLQEMCACPDSFFKSKWKSVLFVLAALGMMLLRHNGFYAFLVFIPFLVLFLRKVWKKVLICTMAAVVLYGAVSAALVGILHADASENQEMLTVPIMQLARVYAYEKETLSEKELETLYRYIPRESLERYNPKVSDLVKVGFDNIAFDEDKGGFFRLWLSTGIKHPATYLNAWFMTSYGFWYPDTVIDVYRGNQVFTFQYGDSSYFGYEVEKPGTRESKLPWLDELYRKMSLEIFQQKVPVLSMLFSPGFLFWVMIFILGGFCYKKWYNKVMPYVLLLLCWLTVIIGPTYLVRYAVFLWVAVPVLLVEVMGLRKTYKK